MYLILFLFLKSLKPNRTRSTLYGIAIREVILVALTHIKTSKSPYYRVLIKRRPGILV